MKVSHFPISTLRETPADAEIKSHQLMLKAGMIKRVSSGLYTWAPFGLKVMRKVEEIVRDELNKAGLVELLMPTVQPAELWQESGRWEQFGPELLRMNDRKGAEFCYGPTHEEIITDYARKELKSYKELPVTYYQIQTKFRDEVRPRFGVMRSREFIMKDAYSFHTTQESLQETYDQIHAAYSRIFERMGLTFRPVLADSGAIGGSTSHEFHVLADSGEDAIAFSDESDYAANIELAVALPPKGERPAPTEEMQTVDTPDSHTIDAVSAFLNKPAESSIKTLIVEGEEEGEVVAILMQGNDQLNELKAEKIDGIGSPLTPATEEQLLQAVGCNAGSIGPVGLKIRIFADHAVKNMADFVCGANVDDKHHIGVNWGRDLPEPEYVDVRNVVEGDPSPDGKGTLSILRGIEVGHIFQLGTKYSEAMNATVLGENGKPEIMTMGCYGIGITRVVAASIEQSHDDNGIIWPAALAPFQLSIVPINYNKSEDVKAEADALYEELIAAGYDVLLDDRNMRPGAMFADHELIGIPHRIVISDRGLKEGQVEFKSRTDDDANDVQRADIMQFVADKLKA
ncbi:proline--tRNA ligase [Cocleimonas sp. KMM 6892]|uniref:proline--tRNA ligase n=1 Tax=unclassified Cocleimonas TaxID=2639732 RepID=UPI002DBEC7E2|nr:MULTISPECIES: proline--tRNA ligase [unclassified Cocleimonas]MEB8432043.1 proline--tRNA ligase [Cocleimonas sp. KMM 6892]MEC4714871.1 proline--tRNA ligase [Cocleimonas sp. KMM 6895]MEC4744315.1 proline--tRNA ligase [Cocleimonas sp. KMM 6896]